MFSNSQIHLYKYIFIQRRRDGPQGLVRSEDYTNYATNTNKVVLKTVSNKYEINFCHTGSSTIACSLCCIRNTVDIIDVSQNRNDKDKVHLLIFGN